VACKTDKEPCTRISLTVWPLGTGAMNVVMLEVVCSRSFITMVVLAGGAYLFVKEGGISMETTAPPLPLEKTVSDMALRASMGNAADLRNPLRFNDDTMLAAAQIYKQNCVVCHGTPVPRTSIAKGMFPDPPRSEVAPVSIRPRKQLPVNPASAPRKNVVNYIMGRSSRLQYHAVSRARKASMRALACPAIAIGKKLNAWAPPG